MYAIQARLAYGRVVDTWQALTLANIHILAQPATQLLFTFFLLELVSHELLYFPRNFVKSNFQWFARFVPV